MASFIKNIHISEPPGRIPTTGWQDEHLSVSPNGRYALRYYDPYEVTNSAYYWQIALLENGSDVTHDHPALMSIPLSIHNEDDNPYIWNYTGQVVTLARWHEPRLYYNIEKKELFQIECNEVGQLHFACFSPTWDRLLVTSEDYGVLCDSAGNIQHINRLRNPHENEYPTWQRRIIYWISSGRDFITVDRTSAVSKFAVTIYSGLSGRVLGSREIDVPAFCAIEVTRAKKSLLTQIRSLVSGEIADNAVANAGYLTERWGGILYDACSNTLYIGFSLPGNTPPVIEGDNLVIKIDTRYVAVEFEQ